MNDETNRRNDPFDHFHQKKEKTLSTTNFSYLYPFHQQTIM